jgi:Protein of unknown function (DUF433)
VDNYLHGADRSAGGLKKPLVAALPRSGCWGDSAQAIVTYLDRIVRDPAICAGQPVIRGTRVLVRVVLGYLAHGETTAHIVTASLRFLRT